MQNLNLPRDIVGCQVDQLPAAGQERLEALRGLDLAAQAGLAIVEGAVDVENGPMGQQSRNLGGVAAALAVVAAFQKPCNVGQVEGAICTVASM